MNMQKNLSTRPKSLSEAILSRGKGDGRGEGKKKKKKVKNGRESWKSVVSVE